MVEILKQIASGNAISIVPLRKEVTTYEAAEILNVSRPFVIGLLEKGEMPSRRVGTHRRIPLSAVLEYERKTDAIRDEALDFLAAQAQELNSIRVAWRRSRRCWTPVYSIPPGFAIFF